MTTVWKFEIGDLVAFKYGDPSRKGNVIGRAEYENGMTSFFVLNCGKKARGECK